MIPKNPTSSFKSNLEFPKRLLEVPLKMIDAETMYQSRVAMSPKKVDEYVFALRNKVIFPPLLLAEKESSEWGEKYILLDGWHRYQAMQIVGFSEPVKVEVLTVPNGINVHALRYLGARGNLTNGLGLTTKDKRELFRAYVGAKQHRNGVGFKGYRTIAEELMLIPHQTLYNWMRQDFPAIAKAMGDVNRSTNAAEGTGKRLTPMPDLNGREIKLNLEEVFEAARESSDQERWAIAEQVKALLNRLYKECPGTPPPESDF